MQVVLEKPITWLESERDGDRNRLMYSVVLQALRNLCANVTEINTQYGNVFSERTAPEDGVLISYHSVGKSSNVWRLKETPIPFFYNLDRLGYSGWSELSVDMKRYETIVAERDAERSEAYCKNLSEWLIRENLSKYAQAHTTSSVGSGFVLFPMQVRTDSVAAHNRIDPLAVLRVASSACRRQRKRLLVKRHPYCTSKQISFWLRLESTINKYVDLTDASVTALLPACDAVLVGNSGVGLEAIVYGKPVYSFARSEYDMAAYQLYNKSDVQNVLSKTPSRHPNGYKFADYFFSERCFDVRDPNDVLRKLRDLVGIH